MRSPVAPTKVKICAPKGSRAIRTTQEEARATVRRWETEAVVWERSVERPTMLVVAVERK
jgi:hypothetical protein